MDKQVTLILKPLVFFSPQFDEDMMFEWLSRIKSITGHKGIGRELHVYVASNNIPKGELLELRGLFERYNFDIKQLKVFMNTDNKHLKMFTEKSN